MDKYDIIVVGGGSAGAVLAARLSENPSTSLLLLEAGRDYRAADAPVEMRGPNFIEIVRHGGFHWPEMMARRHKAQSPKLYLQGRGLGGGSAINATGAVRGIPADYDEWSDQGCHGWKWAEVLSAFIRLEDDRDFGERSYHGKDGPIPIERAPRDQWGAVAAAFAEAALDIGHPWCEDRNAPEGSGISPAPRNLRCGARVSTNDAYLEPVRERSNLEILGDALVDRVEFSGLDAIGIRVRTPRGTSVIRSTQIVLCAGAIHSPAILMRSGIGTAADLVRLGIEPLVDLPGVGKNLADHPLAIAAFALRPNARAPSLRTAPYGCGLRMTSPLGQPNDLVMYAGEVGESVAEGVVGVAVMRPFSQGQVTIVSIDPVAEPLVEFGMLEDGRDVDRLRNGVRHAIEIVRHRAFLTVVEKILDPSDQVLADDATLTNWLLDHCDAHLHPGGTCRMGPSEDARSVVDSKCRVLGVSGLRVIDASIMPNLPRAATHLTTVMIAEHMAQCLLKTLGS